MNFIIPIDVYGFEIMFSFGESDEILYSKLCLKVPNKDLKSKKLWQLDKICGVGRYVMFSNGASLIRMPTPPKSCKEYGVLSHEIFMLFVKY